jgi:hypothetical protein
MCARQIAGTSTRYVFDDEDVLQGTSASTVREYLNGPGIDDRLTNIKSRPHGEHVQGHEDADDSRRWGGKRK